MSCGRLGQDIRSTSVDTNETKSGDKTAGHDQVGYLMRGDSTILFVQWTRVDKSLNGQLQMFAIQGQNQKTFATSTHSFTGVNDDGKISLNFTGSVWTDGLGGRTWTGGLQNNELTLVAPSKDGTLMPLKFTPATVGDYNQAVVGLKTQAERTNEELQQQRETAAKLDAQQRAVFQRQQAVVEANQRVANMIADLQNQSRDLYRAAKVDNVIPQLEKSLAQMQATVNRMKETAAETPLTASKLREVESILREVESNKRQVESDVRSMESAVRGIESYMRPVVAGLSNLQSGWEDLKQAGRDNSTNTPPVRFTEHDIEQEEKAAQTAIAEAKQIGEGGLRQAKGFDDQAQRILDSARMFVRKLRAAE